MRLFEAFSTSVLSAVLASSMMSGCRFDKSGLTEPGAVCGNNIIENGETCDDGNETDGDGCSSSCVSELDCAGTCPDGCCTLTGTCLSGDSDLACGMGAVCVDCTAQGLFCIDNGCQPPPPCTSGESRRCGNCGTQLCDGEGVWQPCQDEGDCIPGVQGLGDACGDCGQILLECTASCSWESAGCANEGECTPQAVEHGESCGTCGTEQRTCDEECGWGTWECRETSPTTYYQDSDGDQYGDPEETREACERPFGYVENDGDCNDGDYTINPDGTDICSNCIDEDCTGDEPQCDTQASMTFAPPSPSPNGTVQVEVHSPSPWACLELVVKGPGGFSTSTTNIIVGGPDNTWRASVTLGPAGRYTFTFNRDAYQPCNEGTKAVICTSLDIN